MVRALRLFSGLGTAFFQAGTKSVLVSSWPVHSQATTLLMVNLFKNLSARPDISRDQSLRHAMQYLIEKEGGRDVRGKLLFSYAHPIFWAPFFIVGEPRRY